MAATKTSAPKTDDRRVPDAVPPPDPPPTAHRSTTDQIREMEGEGQAQDPAAADTEPGTGPDGTGGDDRTDRR